MASTVTRIPRIFRVYCLAFLLLAGASAAAQTLNTGATANEPVLREVEIAAGAFMRNVPLPAWSEWIENLPDSGRADPVVIRLADTRFYLAKEPVVLVHRAMQANEASALSHLGQYEVEFQPEYQRIELHVLRVLRGGQVLDRMGSASVRFMQPERDAGNAIYTGMVKAVIVTQDIRAGDTLEVAYSLIGQNPVFGAKFIEAASWDGQFPIWWRRVTLDAPVERKIHYKVVGPTTGAAVVPLERLAAGRKVTRFEARNISAVEYETYFPPDAEPWRWIQFSEFDSWRDVSRWAVSLFQSNVASPELDAVLASMPAAASPADKVSSALEFVQNQIRYLSISIGENSHRPYPPDQVLARRYGDCKDKSLLLVALLRRAGIDAAPVLASIEHRKGLDALLPSPAAFDHAIVRVRLAGKTYFLDPTRLGQTGLIDRMGQAMPYAQVLVVAPESDRLAEISASPAELLVDSRVEKVTVKKMGEPVELAVHLQYVGLSAEGLRALFARTTAEQLKKAYEGNVDRRYPGAEMLGKPEVSDDRLQNSITIDLRYRIPNFFQATKDRGWYARYNAVNFDELFYVPTSARRINALYVPSFPYAAHYEFEMLFPEEYDVRRRPEQNTLRSSAFVLNEALSFTGRRAAAELNLQLTADRVMPEGIVNFLADLRKAGEMQSGVFVVDANDLKKVAAPEAALPLKFTIAERLESNVKNIGENIAHGGITSRDMVGALCEKALASAYLDHAADALRDAQAAVKLQPDSREGLRCRGIVYFVNGELEKSAADFSRIVTLGKGDGEMYFYRGLVNYYRDRFNDAAEDFSLALAQTTEPADQSRAAVWQSMALRRLQKPAVVSPSKIWPAQILGVLNKTETPDVLLRQIHNGAGDDLEPVLAEAYLYIGQYYLLGGERAKALAFFQRAVEKGILYSPFFQAAKYELKRIKFLG